jgi:hypothetical protein
MIIKKMNNINLKEFNNITNKFSINDQTSDIQSNSFHIFDKNISITNYVDDQVSSDSEGEIEILNINECSDIQIIPKNIKVIKKNDQETFELDFSDDNFLERYNNNHYNNNPKFNTNIVHQNSLGNIQQNNGTNNNVISKIESKDIVEEDSSIVEDIQQIHDTQQIVQIVNTNLLYDSFEKKLNLLIQKEHDLDTQNLLFFENLEEIIRNKF